jgi:hypothetical protein
MGSAKPEDKHSRCGIRSEVEIDGTKSCPYMVRQTPTSSSNCHQTYSIFWIFLSCHLVFELQPSIHVIRDEGRRRETTQANEEGGGTREGKRQWRRGAWRHPNAGPDPLLPSSAPWIFADLRSASCVQHRCISKTMVRRASWLVRPISPRPSCSFAEQLPCPSLDAGALSNPKQAAFHLRYLRNNAGGPSFC